MTHTVKFLCLCALSQFSTLASALSMQFQSSSLLEHNSISQYKLGLQIDSSDMNCLCTTEETQQKYRELSTEQ